MPIRVRLALIVAAGLTVLLLATGWAFLHQLRGSLTASIDSSLWTRRHALLTNLSLHATPVAFSGTQLLNSRDQVIVHSTDDVHGSLITKAELERARDGPIWLYSGGGGEPSARLLAFPLPAGAPASVAVVSSSLGLLDAAVTHVEQGFLIGGPVIVLGGAFVAWLLAGASLRPVERMRRQAAAATADGTAPVLDVPGTRDELAALAATMNDLLGRLREALARERSFVADAGHELRTPLSILRMELELAGRPNRTRAELAAAISSAAEETERLTRLAEALLLLAHDSSRSVVRRELDVRAVLERAVSGFASRVGAPGIEVSVSPEGLMASWDEDRIRQVLSNLIDNALRYSPPDQAVTVSARGFPGRVVVSVRDRGPGFEPDFLPHAFERFTRADAARASSSGGAGLGLSIVSVIAAAHGGRASARNDAGGGAVVEVEIPEDVRTHTPAASPSQGSSGTLRANP